MGLRKKSGHNLDYLVIFTMSNENHEELRPCTLLKDSIYFCLPTFVSAHTFAHKARRRLHSTPARQYSLGIPLAFY